MYGTPRPTMVRPTPQDLAGPAKYGTPHLKPETPEITGRADMQYQRQIQPDTAVWGTQLLQGTCGIHTLCLVFLY